MTIETKIKEACALYLLDAREPDIVRFVDQLFHLAAENGNLAGVLDGDKSFRLVVRPPRPGRRMGLAPAPAKSQAACIVEHEAARSVLRMICARLGVLCKERTATEISLYGDKAVMDYDVPEHRRWSVSFTNTPQHQEFLLEAL